MELALETSFVVFAVIAFSWVSRTTILRPNLKFREAEGLPSLLLAPHKAAFCSSYEMSGKFVSGIVYGY